MNYQKRTVCNLCDGFGIGIYHYPIPCYNNHYYGWYHLYGHVHKSFEWNMMERVKYEMKALYDKECQMYNVEIMIPYMEYMPKTLEEIIEAESMTRYMILTPDGKDILND